MMSRLALTIALLSVIVMGTVSPAETCAMWCWGSHGGHEHHEVAPGLVSHHHAGMGHPDPTGSSSVGARLCATNCSAAVALVAGKSLPQERVKSLPNVVVDVRAAECDGSAVPHFEVAGPPGLARCGKSILRI